MPIAIGDIHGCLKELRKLLAQLPEDEELVFLGDYVDRGPHSREVIAFVQELASRRPCQLLMGNHEDLMAKAIADAGEIGFWLNNGGRATLESHGADPQSWTRLKTPEEREAALPGFMDFHRSLTHYHEDEHAICVHAGVDVSIPRMENQDPNVLIWTREAFFRNAQKWGGKPIFFGHSPTRGMGLRHGEVFHSHGIHGIDTGCVYGGRLTAIHTVTLETWQVEML